jgi:hypothetical protein
MSPHGSKIFPAGTKPGAQLGSAPRISILISGILHLSGVSLVAVLLTALTALAQYPGKLAQKTSSTPELRAIAVLEWTGEEGKLKASRLIPVAVLDASQSQDNQLQDGGIYLARPVPLALANAVEYELQQNGKPIGLFDVLSAGQELGSWIGHGSWKALPVAKPKSSAQQMTETAMNDENSDRPVLHRKKHADDASKGGSSTSASSTSTSGSSSTETAPAADPDRPTLHKKDSGSSDTTASSSPSSDSGSSETVDSDRPTLKKSTKKQAAEDVAHVDSLPEVTDPNRPRLMRGKPVGDNLVVAPTLMGLPADMNQAVAVSDAKSRPEHLWSFTWANPDDAAKMKAALENIARQALGLTPPPAPAAPAKSKRTTTHKNAKAAPATTEPAAPLADERFSVFELAYGSGATMVLTARTEGDLAQQKFVTLIAQPSLYGDLLVLFKSVTDGAHLDITPRMRLVDAVDALADNRGELLFELRGSTQRQFALYRVLRGQVQQLLVTGGGEIAAGNAQ